MSVDKNLSWVPYEGNGSTTSFEFKNRIDNAGELVVVTYNTDTGLPTVLGTSDYTATGFGTNTITVTPNTIVPRGTNIILATNYDFLQEVPFVDFNEFPAQNFQDSLDKAALERQQLLRLSDQALKIPIQDLGTASVELPNSGSRVNGVLGFDADGSVTIYPRDSSSAINSFRSFSGTLSAGQTSITVPSHTVNTVPVFLFINGSKIEPSAYTETNSTTLVLDNPALGGETYEGYVTGTVSIEAISSYYIEVGQGTEAQRDAYAEPLERNVWKRTDNSPATYDVYTDGAWISFGGGGGTQTASEVPFTPYATLASTNVQDAIQELLDEISVPVDSVNGQTGAVVLDADDVDDSATTNKFVTSADVSKLANVPSDTSAEIALKEDILWVESAMPALEVDTTPKTKNTKTLSTDATLTFSGTPTAGSVFVLEWTNTDTDYHTLTIPSCYSNTIKDNTTSLLVQVGVNTFTFWYDGSTYNLFGDIGIRDNMAASSAPAVSNDDTSGYGVSSRWLDTTTNFLYECVDASTGAAVWLKIGGLITDNISGNIAEVADQDYIIVLNVGFAGTITKTTTKSASGTCTFTFKVNTTALGGTANSVSSSEQEQTHSTSNSFVAGDNIVITASSNSACLFAAFSIEFTRLP